MKVESLFSALRSYRPRPTRDSLEDFVTEGWCWLLKRFPTLSRDYLSELASRSGIAPLELHALASAAWSTQVSLPGCRLDMVAELGDELTFVFEHKAWSGLGQPQVDKYRTVAQKHWPGVVNLVLVTAAPKQWIDGADVRLTWADVHDLCGRWVDSADAADSYLVEDFRVLLRSESLGPPPQLDQETIRSYLPGQRFVPALQQIINSLLDIETWSPIYNRFDIPGHGPRPHVDWTRQGNPRWGRCGIDLFDVFIPGLFVGVILDGTDHRVDGPSNPHLGPDFHLIVTWDHLKAEPDLETLVNSDEFTSLRARLRENEGTWELVDHYFNPDREPRNRWNPLHLRRPLARVMAGCSTLQETRDRFLEAGLDAADHLLSGGELADLLARVRPRRRND